MTRRWSCCLPVLTGMVPAALLSATLVGVGWPASVVAQAERAVSYERLLDAPNQPENWLTYNGDYSGRRYSGLDQINRENVDDLQVAWVYQMQRPGIVETTPIVFDGLMIITEPPSTVSALDVNTGRRVWTFRPTIPPGVKTLGFPPVNRGVAVLGNRVFFGTIDAWLYALDLESGAVRWKTQVAENRTGHSITAAPLALDGAIIVGISGGEAGIRGFIDAYHPETGERLWRFWTIPGPGEPGNETWGKRPDGGESWPTGAGATWLTGVYDPEADLLYWGVGNPGPDWNGDVRPGDNLYTSSVVALRPKDGSLAWYFQFTPHDTHDWDANQIQMLVDTDVGGEQRKVLVTANRNAFYYVVDRLDGRFLTAQPYARQTWAEGIDESGRPIVIPGTEPTKEGVEVWPSLQGATNWYSPAYSPLTELVYVPTREMGAIYFKADADYEEGEYFMGGGQQNLEDDKGKGFVRALEVRTGATRWEWEMLTPPTAGLLATAGGLVFGGTNEGHVFALDADSGELLWRFQSGARIATNPMSYEHEGRQYVVTSAGTAMFAFALPAD